MSSFSDRIALDLEHSLEDVEGFAARHGRSAGAMAEHLPALSRLMHRVSFDLHFPLEARQLAALGLMYLAEPNDYLRGTNAHPVDGLLDDVWVTYRTLDRLGDLVAEDKLATHWRSTTQLADVMALGQALDSVEAALPSRVLSLIKQYLGEPEG